MIWLDPWWSTADQPEAFCAAFCRQLALEAAPGHILYDVPVKLLARGNGDDALFALQDGSNRVANVHLSWSRQQNPLPWPITTLFHDLQDWAQQVMLPEHQQWAMN